jgi:hypothetical protein
MGAAVEVEVRMAACAKDETELKGFAVKNVRRDARPNTTDVPRKPE